MKISVRQICFIMFAYTAVSKLLLYPTFLSSVCGRDLLFPSLIVFAVESLVIWAVSYLSAKTDKTFFQLVEGTMGKVTARIIYALFALFFVLAAILPLFEQKLYVHAIFYDSVSSLLVFLPFFFFAVYAGSKGFENIGRCADICLPVFLIAMAMIFLMSFGEVHPDNILPVLRTPVKNIFGGALATTCFFVEPCWLLMFMGHFKHKKGDTAKITISYVCGAAIVMLFLFVFYGIYGDLAQSRHFAVSKTSLFFSAVDLIGRIDLIALYILETVMLFTLVLNVQMATHCLSEAASAENPNRDMLAIRGAFSFIVCAVLAAILIVCDNMFNALFDVFSKWMWIVYLIFVIVVPLLAWTLRRRER